MSSAYALVLLACLSGAAFARSAPKQDPQGGSCILDVNNDLPKKNEPLLLERVGNNLNVLLPETEGKRGVIALREGQEVVVACPGNKNFLVKNKAEVSRAVCRRGTTLAVDGSEVKSVDLDCNSRSTAAVKVTDTSCANGKGVIIELGFEAEGWTKLVDTCHNIESAETFFAHHWINGDKIAGKVIRPGGTRPGFARGDRALFKGFNPDTAYSQRNQNTVLSRLLGKKANGMLDTRNLFMARGHLTPDADFIFSPHQFLTYFYVNVAPQWQSINAGNWLRVEDNVRRAAVRLGADLEVVTGTYGILKLEDDKGAQKEIRLQGDRLPVPELFWKVIRNSQDDSCVAFVSSNNPYAKGAPPQLCKDVCKSAGWPVLQDDLPKGYVYCCEYSDFRKSVKDFPDLQCKSLLRGQ